MKKKKMSHIDNDGRTRMVDVGGKPESDRYALAEGRIRLSKKLLAQLRTNTLAKGDALSAARIAGIMAAKKTSEIIPLCHTIPLTEITVDLKLVDNPPSVEIKAEARTHYKTGVEMEALTAVAVCALTIYDMCKAVDRGMRIEGIRLARKSGGKSGVLELE